MHPELLKDVVALCRRRWAPYADCPIEAPANVETLENAVMQLADDLATCREGTRPQGDEWIACSERLPETAETVTAWNGYIVIAGCQYHAGRWIGAGGVTHWRPLPAPPTKKEAGA